MNRVIKFRGQRTDGKGWVYGDLMRESVNRMDEPCIVVLNPTGNEPTNFLIPVLPETVGQYTGLTNTVHKCDVYEGDIISDDGHLIGTVMFGAGTRGWLVKRSPTSAHYETLNDLDPDDSDWEVTGNIHEQKQEA